MFSLVVFLIFLVSLPFLIYLHAYTVATLWEWFISPVFGLNLLTMPQAYGLAIVIAFLVHPSNSNEYKKKGDQSEKVIISMTTGVIKPLMVLLIGWIVKTFFM